MRETNNRYREALERTIKKRMRVKKGERSKAVSDKLHFDDRAFGRHLKVNSGICDALNAVQK